MFYNKNKKKFYRGDNLFNKINLYNSKRKNDNYEFLEPSAINCANCGEEISYLLIFKGKKIEIEKLYCENCDYEEDIFQRLDNEEIRNLVRSFKNYLASLNRNNLKNISKKDDMNDKKIVQYKLF